MFCHPCTVRASSNYCRPILQILVRQLISRPPHCTHLGGACAVIARSHLPVGATSKSRGRLKVTYDIKRRRSFGEISYRCLRQIQLCTHSDRLIDVLAQHAVNNVVAPRICVDFLSDRNFLDNVRGTNFGYYFSFNDSLGTCQSLYNVYSVKPNDCDTTAWRYADHCLGNKTNISQNCFALYWMW